MSTEDKVAEEVESAESADNAELTEDNSVLNASVDSAETAKIPDGIDAMSVEDLIEALAASRAEVQEMKDGYLRAKAEMENIRRRSQNEVISARKYAVEGFATEMLTVKDSLDQASQVELDETDIGALEKMREGLALTLKQLDVAMAKFAVTEVEAASGVKFDPELHQAISMVPSDSVESNHIVDVMQKGFVLKDRLLRPAMVVVAS